MKILVTGGAGFLGATITRMLLARGDQVRVFARGHYPALEQAGASLFQGDVRDAAAVRQACEGMDAVIHTAAKAGAWGPYEVYKAINVDGTQNIIDACVHHGIRYLVNTSSPSVVLTGKDIVGADEHLPYSNHYLCHYPPTKAEAERRVTAANGLPLSGGSGQVLRTVSLRPHLIWGPGDAHILPRLARLARTGQLRRIGEVDPVVDCVFVDNAAEAHLNALDKLRSGADLQGKAYFITNGAPVHLWQFANQMLEAVGVPPVTKVAPRWIAYAAASVIETLYHLFRIQSEPRLTRFAVSEMSCSHWFKIDAARRDLGYSPRVSMTEGLERLREAPFSIDSH